MTEDIKFATLENGEVRITIEDARYISLESETVASILAGKFREEEYADLRYGGVAIILALEYCRKLGEIKYRSSQPSESKSDASNHFAPLAVETQCKEVDKEAWIDDFTVRITNYGPGMAYELAAVSRFLLASGLIDLTCQCIFDYLTFKDYRDFRKAFAFQFLFPPYFDSEEIQNIENVLECILKLPTLDEIHAEFKDKIPFTADELELAESENKSLRVGGNLEYKTNKRSTEELLIKVEYMVRRLSSFQNLSFWMTDAFAKCITETFAYLKGFFDDQSNNDIGQLRSTLCEPGSKFHLDFVGHLYYGAVAQKIANPSRSYEDINVIKDDMDKIELEMAAEANLLKRKAEESCERCYTNWQNGYPHHKDKLKRKAEELCEGCYTNWQNDRPHHKDKVFPHLIYFLENRYQEIYCALCSLRRWMTAHEVQYYFNKLNVCNKTTFEYAYDQNEDQDEDVESEEQNEDCHEDEGNEGENEDNNEDEGSEVLHSQESEADRQIRDGIVASLRRLTGLALGASRDFTHVYKFYQKLQIEMRMVNHVNLLIKDEKMLAFICKEKFNLYMRASKQGTTSMISFAENKEEVRREKISERMKYLQDLVPGCSNITGKASILDEIINYVQSLQKQIEFLSMKLAAAYPVADCSSMQNYIVKEVQVNSSCCTAERSLALQNPAFQLLDHLQPDIGASQNELAFMECGSSAWDYNHMPDVHKLDCIVLTNLIMYCTCYEVVDIVMK